MSSLSDPKLAPGNDGSLRSERYGDIYFQRSGAQQETRLVFLAGCDLPRRWRGQRRHTVAETGFGTGLNFLETWRLWRAHRRPKQRLHYVSVEAHPLTVRELAGIHQRWPGLAKLSRSLRQQYPALTPGFHRVELADNVILTLLLGDVLDGLEQLEATVDSWYLDGFSPSRNPRMWRPEVLQQVARLSAPAARLATFTTASRVREALAAAGFELSLAPGFGDKRERLTGVFTGRPASACPGWFQPPPPLQTDTVTIIGGGVGGQCLASALRRRQLRPELLDEGPAASGNPSVSVMPRLEAGDGAAGRFFWHAYRYALAYWRRRAEFFPCGAMMLAASDAEAARFQRIEQFWRAGSRQLVHLDPAGLREASGLSDLTGAGALWFPEAGVVRNYGRAAVSQRRVRRLTARDGGWELDTGSGVEERAAVVLATGAETVALETGLALQPWRGQAVRMAQTPASRQLRCALFGDRYLHPPQGGQHWAGASFELPGAPAAGPRLADEVAAAYPALAFDRQPRGQWSGWRMATPDRLPLAGPVLDMSSAAHALRWVRGGRPGRAAPWRPGLFFLGGLGARGFTTAPLLAEWLASMLVADPWPLPRDLALAVCSSRFLVRDLRRGKAPVTRSGRGTRAR